MVGVRVSQLRSIKLSIPCYTGGITQPSAWSSTDERLHLHLTRGVVYQNAGGDLTNSRTLAQDSGIM